MSELLVLSLNIGLFVGWTCYLIREWRKVKREHDTLEKVRLIDELVQDQHTEVSSKNHVQVFDEFREEKYADKDSAVVSHLELIYSAGRNSQDWT